MLSGHQTLINWYSLSLSLSLSLWEIDIVSFILFFAEMYFDRGNFYDFTSLGKYSMCSFLTLFEHRSFSRVRELWGCKKANYSFIVFDASIMLFFASLLSYLWNMFFMLLASGYFLHHYYHTCGTCSSAFNFH